VRGISWGETAQERRDPGEAKSSRPAISQNGLILRVNGGQVKDRAWYWMALGVCAASVRDKHQVTRTRSVIQRGWNRGTQWRREVDVMSVVIYSSTSSSLIIGTHLHRLPYFTKRNSKSHLNQGSIKKCCFCSYLIHHLRQEICNASVCFGGIGVVLGPGIRQGQATCRSGRIIRITSCLLIQFSYTSRPAS
jgi:hypothetical protein